MSELKQKILAIAQRLKDGGPRYELAEELEALAAESDQPDEADEERHHDPPPHIFGGGPDKPPPGDPAGP